MNLDALDRRVVKFVRHQILRDDGEIRGNGLTRLRARPSFAKMNRRITFEFDLRLEHHRSLARRALRVRDDRVGGHGENQRRELRMTHDADVIGLRRSAAVDRQLDGNHRCFIADDAHDSGRTILSQRADDRAGVRQLE